MGKTNKFKIGDLVSDGKNGVGIIVELSDRSLDKTQTLWVYHIHYAIGFIRWEMEYGLHRIESG